MRKRELEGRVEHCDTYHMPLDEQLQDFHNQLAATAENGTVADFAQTFSDIEDSRRAAVLMEMYQKLPPVEQARLVAQLAGNLSMKEFVDAIDTSRDAYEDAMLRIEAETQEYQAFRTADVPVGTTLKICMSIMGRVREAIGLQAKAELPWDRLFVARALGGNHFTIAEEDYGGDYNYVDGEPFTAHDTVTIGTPMLSKKNGLYLDHYLRFGEAFGVRVGNKKARALNVIHKPTATPISLRINKVIADDRLLLPYLDD